MQLPVQSTDQVCLGLSLLQMLPFLTSANVNSEDRFRLSKSLLKGVINYIKSKNCKVTEQKCTQQKA